MRIKLFVLFFSITIALHSQTCLNDVMHFNGINNYINIGSSVGNGLRSIEFWFRPNINITPAAPDPGYSMIIRNDGSQYSEYGVYIRGTDWSSVGNVGRLCFFVRYSGVLHELMSDNNNWVSGTWYHVAGVIDNASGMKLYINGIQQSMTDPIATTATQTHSNITNIGAWGDVYVRYFKGRLDEMRLWNRGITQTEIQTKMCLHLDASVETGLVAYWNFNEGSGTQIIDSTSGGFNAPISGTTWINESYCTSSLSLSTSSNTICASATGTATANPSNGIFPYSYLWSNGQTTQTAVGLNAGTYTVFVTDSAGCTLSQSVTVDSSSLNAFTSTTPATCTSSNGSITVNPTNGVGPYSYLWNTGQTTQTITGLTSGNYNVLVTDSTGCSFSQSAIVGSTGALALSSSSSSTKCITNTGTATVQALTGTAPYSYLWSNGQTTQTAIGLAAGNYTVNVTDNNGCSLSETIQVASAPAPMVDLASQTFVVIGSATTLTASGGLTYSWSPTENLSCADCSAPLASPIETTTYCVFVTDSNNCSATACIEVDVLCTEVFIPSAFSPNNDGKNDLLYAYSPCFKEIEFAIFDRWGEKVFETKDPSKGWDGTFKGVQLNTAVFDYFLKAILMDGTEVSKKGNIHLIR